MKSIGKKEFALTKFPTSPACLCLVVVEKDAIALHVVLVRERRESD